MAFRDEVGHKEYPYPRPRFPSRLSRQERWQHDRKAWDALLQESWYLDQALEPAEHYSGRSILVRWLSCVEAKEKKGWRCDVPVEGETRCQNEIESIDRAIIHVRAHLDLKPFPCEGRCNKENCTARFTSKQYLTAHIGGPDLKECEWCGEVWHRQNLSRHMERCAMKPSEQTAEGSSTSN